MSSARPVRLIREESDAAVYLIVGDARLHVTSVQDMQTLGFTQGVEVVDDGTYSSLPNLLTAELGGAPTGARASDVSFRSPDPFVENWDGTKDPASIIARDVLAAGWLASPEGLGQTKAVTWEIPAHQPWVEDVHYSLYLDTDFMLSVYGAGGFSDKLWNAQLPGNPPGNPVPFRSNPSNTRGVTASSFVLPEFANDANAQASARSMPGIPLHVELNAWKAESWRGDMRNAIPPTWYRVAGRGQAPAGWGNYPCPDPPPTQDSEKDAWFPYDPRFPSSGWGDGGPLAVGDYVIMRGTLWQDNPHDSGIENYGNHSGWLELHPPDWIMRLSGRAVNRTSIPVCLHLGPAIPTAVHGDVYRDVPGHQLDGQVLWVAEDIDYRFEYILPVEKERIFNVGDHAHIDASIIQISGQVFKAVYSVGWQT